MSFIHPQIQLPTTGLDISSSDSSDFSSEDDSTVVHMKTRSRSPSPHKGKHRSHRSSGHSCSGSPARAKIKELDIPDAPPSNTLVTAESESAGQPAEGNSSQQSAPGEKKKDTEVSGVWYTTTSCCCHRSHSQMLCLSFDTSTTLYVFCNENVQFLMPSFSGIAVWFIQKA